MLKTKIAIATIAICLIGLAKLAVAQTSPNAFRPFNGFFADMFDDDNQTQPRPQHQRQQYDNVNSDGTAQPQRAPTRAPKPAPLAAPPSDADLYSAPPVTTIDNSVAPPARTLASRPQAQGSVTGKNYAFQYDDAQIPGNSSAGAPTGAVLNRSVPGTSVAGDAANSPAVPTPTTGMPLHEQLKAFRRSPFADAAQTTSVSNNPPSASASAELAPAQPAATVAQNLPTLAAPPTDAAPSSPAVVEAKHPAIAKRGSDAALEPNVLLDHKTPLLTVQTIGPRKIVVGKEAAYEVLLQNSGDAAAEEVTVTVSLPDWAEMAGASASNGEVRPIEQDHHNPCRWVLGRIEARSKEKLALKIIPRQSKPFELAVRWDFKQAPSQAMIEVQEPKLTIHLDGPREVLFGKHEIYKLKLGNSGNGPAENVLLTLMPLNASDTHPITHRLGTINAGDDRSIEIELTARQAGNLTIRVEANGDGGSHVDLAEHILVHRAALQIEAEGPAVQYVGTPANFRIHVRNPGDAAAKNVKLTAKLPTGVKFVSGSDGAISEAADDGGKVRWTLDQLQPGEQKVLDLKCTLALSGANRLEISSSADDELVAATEAVTRVEAVADLRMEVKDPEGPVPVGSEALYELRIRNRGTKAAENVEVMAYFSNGVEPVSADGQANRLSPGQVVFDLIPAIPPATELVLKVKAKAGVAGNHVFRAELHCKSMGTRLVREEVTHYYQDSPSLQQTAGVPETAPTPPVMRDESRTAERQAPLPLPQSSGQPLSTRAIQR